MRLRHIVSVSFNKSELTNYKEFLLQNPGLELKNQDVILLISKSRDQLVFVYGFDALNKNQILFTSRMRIMTASGGKGVWNPLMLKNYAKDQGITLDGLKKFEEYYKQLREGV
jgi:hypothetical protein